MTGATSEATKTAIAQYIGDFYTYVTENFENAKICIAQIGADTNHTQAGSTRRYNLVNNVTKAYADSVLLKIQYLPNMDKVLKDADLLSPDGVHPSAYGHTVLATALYQAFLHSYNQNFIRYENLTPGAYASGDSIEGYIEIYSDIHVKHLKFNSVAFVIAAHPTLKHSGGYIIGVNNSKTLLPIENLPLNIQVEVATTDSNVYCCNATLYFSVGGNITIEVNQVENNSYIEIANVQYVKILDTSICLDNNII